jgi:hypothetical protein
MTQEMSAPDGKTSVFDAKMVFKRGIGPAFDAKVGFAHQAAFA